MSPKSATKPYKSLNGQQMKLAIMTDINQDKYIDTMGAGTVKRSARQYIAYGAEKG